MGLLMDKLFESEFDSHMEALYKKCTNIVEEIKSIKSSAPELHSLADKINRQLLYIIYKLTSLQGLISQVGRENEEALNDFEIYNMLATYRETLSHIENKLSINKHSNNIADIISIEQLRKARNFEQSLREYLEEVIRSFTSYDGKTYVITGYFNCIAANLIRQKKITDAQADTFLKIVRELLDAKKRLSLTNPFPE